MRPILILALVSVMVGCSPRNPGSDYPKGLPPGSPPIQSAFGFTLGAPLPGKGNIITDQSGLKCEFDDSSDYGPVSGICASAGEDGRIYSIRGYVDLSQEMNLQSALEEKYGPPSTVKIDDGIVSRWGDQERVIVLILRQKVSPTVEYVDVAGQKSAVQHMLDFDKAQVEKISSHL